MSENDERRRTLKRSSGNKVVSRLTARRGHAEIAEIAEIEVFSAFSA
jgi:hypothetical protein